MDAKEFKKRFDELHKKLHDSECSEQAKNDLAILIHEQSTISLRVANYRTLNEYDREDIAQEGTAAVVKKCTECAPGDIDRPQAYVTRATKNHALLYIRKQPEEKFFPLDENKSSITFAEQLEDYRSGSASGNGEYGQIFSDQEQELLTTLIGEIDKNHPRCKYGEILENRFFATPKLPFTEHSEKLGLNIGTYKRQSKEALDLLDEALNSAENLDLVSEIKRKISLFQYNRARIYNRGIDAGSGLHR